VAMGQSKVAEQTESILVQCEELEEGQNLPGWKLKRKK